MRPIWQYAFKVEIPKDFRGDLLASLGEKLTAWSVEMTARLQEYYARLIERGGHPKWPPLDPSTVERRKRQGHPKPRDPLYETGSLTASIRRFETQQQVVRAISGLATWTEIGPQKQPEVGKNSLWMEEQLLGRKASGRDYRTKIVPRRLGLTDEMAFEIARSLQETIRNEYGIVPEIGYKLLWTVPRRPDGG